MFLHNALELHMLYVLFWERFIFIFVKIYLYVHKLAPVLEFVCVSAVKSPVAQVKQAVGCYSGAGDRPWVLCRSCMYF